tara:strand:+ start:4498 stop:4935 length:438 start_codon:yes stop_codon:yes gene_type:complete
MTDINIDELLELAENAKKEKAKRKRGESKQHKSVSRFIEEYPIKPGTDLVPNYVIFYTYRILWKGLTHSNKCNKIVFFRNFNKQFNQKRTGKQRYYLVDASSFDLTREGIEEAKYYDRRYQKENKKKQEKSSKEAESRQEVQSES